MRILLTTATVLLSSAAFGQFGQTVQVRIRSGTGTETLSVGPNLCGGQSAFTWTVTGSPCEVLSLWLTVDTDCKDSASAQTGPTRSLDNITRDTITRQNGTGTTRFNISDLPIFSSGDGGVGCGAGGIDQTVRLCGATKQSTDYLGTCNSVVRASPLKITYDTLPPGAPSIDAVSPLDRALRVDVTPPSDAVEVRVVASRDGAVAGELRRGVGLGPLEVEDLENGVTYELSAYAIDAAGNESTEFGSAEGTPIKTLGFYEKYRESGGREMGGCGAAGGGLAGSAVLAALGFWLFSRRNRS